MLDSAVKAKFLSFQGSVLGIAEQLLLDPVGNWFQILALPAHMVLHVFLKLVVVVPCRRVL